MRFYRSFLMYFLEKSHDRFCTTHFKSMCAKTTLKMRFELKMMLGVLKGIEFFENI